MSLCHQQFLGLATLLTPRARHLVLVRRVNGPCSTGRTQMQTALRWIGFRPFSRLDDAENAVRMRKIRAFRKNKSDDAERGR